MGLRAVSCGAEEAKVRSRIRPLLLPALVYGLVCAWTLRAVGTAVWPAVPGVEGTDLYKSLWSLWFGMDSLAGGELPWRVSDLGFPGGGTLLPGDLPGALFVAGAEPFLGLAGSYCALAWMRTWLAGMLAHGFAAAWLSKSSRNPSGAWAAGATGVTASVLWAGVYNGTSETFNATWVLAATWLAWRAGVHGGTRRILLAGAGMLLCAMAGWYGAVVALLLVGSMAVLGTGVPAENRPSDRWAALFLGLALAATWAVLAAQAAGHPDSLVSIESPGYLSRLRRGEGAASALGWLVATPIPREGFWHTHHLGWVSSGAALAGAWILRRRGAFLLVAGAAGILLAMGPTGPLGLPLPYALLESLPGFRSLSLLWRLALAPLIATALLAAVLGSRRPWLGPALAFCILGEFLLLSPMRSGVPAVSLAASSPLLALREEPPGAVVHFPAETSGAALYEQTLHGHPLTMTLNAPSNATELTFWEGLSVQAMEQNPSLVESTAKAQGIRYVVVRPGVGMRTDPHRALVVKMESSHTPLSNASDGPRVYRLW